MAKDGIICQVCGIEAPARYVEFHQNIGALVMRFHRSLKGKVCKSCLHRKYWAMTGTTLGIGWLGMISIVVAPIFIIANTVYYLKSLGMPGVPPGARVPSLDQTAIARLNPLANEIIDRLNRGEEMVEIALDVSPRAKVTPGQVVKFVAALSNPSQMQNQPQRAQGFPVVPLPQPPGETSSTPPTLPNL
jgi:hypothetical protein